MEKTWFRSIACKGLTGIVIMMLIMLVKTIPSEATTYGKLTYEIANGEVTITDCEEDVSGEMVTGWQSIGGTWYYFTGDGAMVANQWVGNYYLQADGSMATNKWIGNYYVGPDGVWVP